MHQIKNRVLCRDYFDVRRHGFSFLKFYYTRNDNEFFQVNLNLHSSAFIIGNESDDWTVERVTTKRQLISLKDFLNSIDIDGLDDASDTEADRAAAHFSFAI